MSDSPWFAMDELREDTQLRDARFESIDIEAAIRWVEATFERFVGEAFVPRTRTERLDGNGSDEIDVATGRLLEVTALSIDGVAVDVDDVFVYDDGLLALDGAIFTRGRQNVSVTYTHGYAELPADIRRHAITLIRSALQEDLSGGVEARAVSVSDGGRTFNLALAGPDRPTGIPDVDATLADYKRKNRRPGLA